jgi:Na+/proline symporter
MLGSSVVCILFVAFSLDGGFAALASEALADGKVRVFEWSFSLVHASTWIIVLGSLINNLVPYTSDQTIIQRYMTTRSEAMARRSIWLNGLMSPPSALVFFALGTGFYLFYKHHPGALHPAIMADSMLPYFVHENLPAGIAGVVIAGIFAASQSSVSSSLNSVATVLVTDMIPARGQRSESLELWIARFVTVVAGVICTGLAMLMAGQNIESFFDSYLKLVAITGSGLAGLFALGIFSRRANSLGAGCGVLASALMVYYVQRHTNLHFFFYGMTGFSVCFVVGLLCLRGRAHSEASLAGLTWHTRTRPKSE